MDTQGCTGWDPTPEGLSALPGPLWDGRDNGGIQSMNISIKLHTNQSMKGHKMQKEPTQMRKRSGEFAKPLWRWVWKDPGAQGYPMHMLTREAAGKSRNQGLPGHREMTLKSMGRWRTCQGQRVPEEQKAGFAWGAWERP